MHISPPDTEETIAILRIAQVPITRGQRWHRDIPIQLTAGEEPPSQLCEAEGYYTYTGILVTYPNAYRKHAYRPLFRVRTVAVQVGEQWLKSWRQAGGVMNAKARSCA